MEFHDAANIFPLDEENIGDLAKDIRVHGLRCPIELLDGKIIDGRRRYKACERAGIKPTMKTISTDDPIAYVVSLNLHRRHLTASQRAMVGLKVKEMYQQQAKARQRAGQERGRQKQKGMVEDLPPTTESGKARDLAGKAVGVSGKMIDLAGKVKEKGVPELAEAVEQGRLSVGSAAEIADMDEDTQREIADKAKFSGGRYRKPKIEPKPEEANGRKSVAVFRANEAINSLTRIPKNDPQRTRGMQMVKDWIRRNP